MDIKRLEVFKYTGVILGKLWFAQINSVHVKKLVNT